MLMRYINGTTAMDLHERKERAPFVFGTEEQNARLRRQMARIQVELARCRFDSIGSLQYDERDDAFFIGPELATGLGPWKSLSHISLMQLSVPSNAVRQGKNWVPDLHSLYRCSSRTCLPDSALTIPALSI